MDLQGYQRTASLFGVDWILFGLNFETFSKLGRSLRPAWDQFDASLHRFGDLFTKFRVSLGLIRSNLAKSGTPYRCQPKGGYLHAQAAFRASSLWLRGNTEQLAIIRLCVVAAAPIIPSHTVLILGIMPEIKVAICMIVSIWLTVPCAAKPPRRIILSYPRFLARVTRVHGIAGASSTSVLWSCDVNDPIWRAKRLHRSNDGLPIRA